MCCAGLTAGPLVLFALPLVEGSFGGGLGHTLSTQGTWARWSLRKPAAQGHSDLLPLSPVPSRRVTESSWERCPSYAQGKGAASSLPGGPQQTGPAKFSQPPHFTPCLIHHAMLRDCPLFCHLALERSALTGFGSSFPHEGTWVTETYTELVCMLWFCSFFYQFNFWTQPETLRVSRKTLSPLPFRKEKLPSLNVWWPEGIFYLRKRERKMECWFLPIHLWIFM